MSLDGLTSARGTLALAVSALLLVLGFRLARPGRPREWLAVGAYAAALAAQLLGARGVLPGPVLVAGAAVRIAGAALLVLGLLLAGTPSRARRRAAARFEPPPASRSTVPVYLGLAVVLLGQLARAPSLAGAVVTLAAVVLCALSARPGGARA